MSVRLKKRFGETLMTEQLPIQNTVSVLSVPMIHGWHWIVSGYQMLKAYPMMWAILIILYLIIMVPLSKIPLLGSVLSTLIAPIFASGLLLGCHAISQHKELEINHLFAGFKKNTAQLISLGGLYMLGLIIAAMLFSSGLDPAIIELISNGQPVTVAQLGNMTQPILFAMLVFIPLTMAYWFAPALITFYQLTATQALKVSFGACIKNIAPFLLNMAIFALIFLGLVLLVGLLGQLGEVVIMFGIIVIMPLMITSLFASYQAIFK
jgi:hypothetical protein